MHDITREIINIDKNTSSMKDRYKVLMDKKEEDLRNQILELEKKYTNDSINEGDRVYQEIIKSAERKIMTSGKVKVNYNDTNNNYNKLKSGLIESIWANLFMEKE